MNLRHITTPILAGLVAATFALWAPATPALDKAEFREAFFDNMDLDIETRGRKHVGEILVRPVHFVTFEAYEGHSHTPSRGSIIVYEYDGRLEPLHVPSTDERLPYFDDLLNPDFRLTAERAEAFMDMLHDIMPESLFDKLRIERIRPGDNRWEFLTGTFFDNLKGFVVDVDDEGRITDVSYELGLE